MIIVTNASFDIANSKPPLAHSLPLYSTVKITCLFDAAQSTSVPLPTSLLTSRRLSLSPIPCPDLDTLPEHLFHVNIVAGNESLGEAHVPKTDVSHNSRAKLVTYTLSTLVCKSPYFMIVRFIIVFRVACRACRRVHHRASFRALC